jgi:hypothetical protein
MVPKRIFELFILLSLCSGSVFIKLDGAIADESSVNASLQPLSYKVTTQVRANGTALRTVESKVVVTSLENPKAPSQYIVSSDNSAAKFSFIKGSYDLRGRLSSVSRLGVRRIQLPMHQKTDWTDYVVPLPPLRRDGILTLKYSLEIPPDIKGIFSDKMTLPTSGKEVRIVYESEVPLGSVTHQLEPLYSLKTSKVGAKEVVEISLKDQPRSKTTSALTYPLIFISSARSWVQINSILSHYYESSVNQTLPPQFLAIVDKARRETSQERKLMVVGEEINRLIRCTGDWARSHGTFEPVSFQDLARKRAGDTKDIAALLTSIMRKIGFTASVALTQRSDHYLDRGLLKKISQLPSPDFNHALVAVRDSSGKYFWLDPANVNLIPDTLSSDVIGSFALCKAFFCSDF